MGNWSGGTESWERPKEDDRMTGRGGRLWAEGTSFAKVSVV